MADYLTHNMLKVVEIENGNETNVIGYYTSVSEALEVFNQRADAFIEGMTKDVVTNLRDKSSLYVAYENGNTYELEVQNY